MSLRNQSDDLLCTVLRDYVDNVTSKACFNLTRGKTGLHFVVVRFILCGGWNQIMWGLGSHFVGFRVEVKFCGGCGEAEEG